MCGVSSVLSDCIAFIINGQSVLGDEGSTVHCNVSNNSPQQHRITSQKIGYVLYMLQNTYKQLLTLPLASSHSTAPSGFRPFSTSASILLYSQLISSFLIFPGPAVHPSGLCPSIFFLVFLLILCCGIPH
jgi:hypothetical protein